MNISFWRRLWFWWLIGVAGSFALLEGSSIALNEGFGWTLSDTVRRWSAGERWLAPLVCGFACWLLVHFFGEANKPSDDVDKSKTGGATE